MSPKGQPRFVNARLERPCQDIVKEDRVASKVCPTIQSLCQIKRVPVVPWRFYMNETSINAMSL